MAAEAGQLQLNAMEPLIIYNLLSSLRMLTNACHMLTDRCIKGITANEKHCENLVQNSIGIVTVFSPYLGYEKSSAVAKQALITGGSVVDIIRAERLLPPETISYILKKENLTGPSSMFNDPMIDPVIQRDRSYTHLRESSGGNMQALLHSLALSEEEKKD